MGSPPGAMIPEGHLPRRQSGDDMKPPTSQTSAHAPTSATNGYAPSTMRPHQSALPRSANRRSPNPSPSLERLPEAHAHHTPGDSSISIAALRWLRPVVHRAAHKKFLLEANRRPPSLVDVSRGCHRGPGRRRGDKRAGVRVCAAVVAPGPCPGGRSGVTRVNDSTRTVRVTLDSDGRSP